MTTQLKTGAASTVSALTVGVLLLLVAVPASAQSVGKASRLLAQWQFQEAAKIVEQLAESQPGSPAVHFLKARQDFLHGRYDESVQRMDQLLTNDRSGRDWKQFRDLAAATRDVTKNYEKHMSPKGHFAIYVEPGKDRVLVPYAGEALDRAYEAIGKELGHYPPTPIRVEVYPRTATLAKVSGLTEKEIRTSGTIALCKYNRLMITSPKALLRGYGWVDTLVHEYIHFLINSKTANQVPIWMHEGLAKFLEHRWRGPDAHHLPPSSENLLKKRLEKDDLITFEQMHPSMAKLPSQEDAATAFAEVYTVMEYLQSTYGSDAFRRVLEAIPEAGGSIGAFETVVGKSFSQFEEDWKEYLRNREMAEYPDEAKLDHRLVFKDEKKKGGNTITELDQPKAREHMKLGEMLQARNRFGAAVVQYRKAVRISQAPNPRLRTRLAHSLTETGRPAEAIEALAEVRKLYPSYVSIWIELGKASLADNDPESARDHLLDAARINPFNPEVHELLAQAYRKLNDTKNAEREKRFAQLVR